MKIIVRKPNLEDLTREGIPRDFSEVMEYFNRSLKDNSNPWIPRKKPITLDEIRNLWLPSQSKNICYVAELNGQVVGCATVLYDSNSTAYENATLRRAGELSSTVDSKAPYVEVNSAMNDAVIKELISSARKAVTYISPSSPAVKGMEISGYKPSRIVTRNEFANSTVSREVFEYELP